MPDRYIVFESPLRGPDGVSPSYEVYDRVAGGPVLGRWPYRAQAQQHADECNARDATSGRS